MSTERRLRQRPPAVRLKLEFCRLGWFGRPQKLQRATVREFTLNGLTMRSDVKLKTGQRLLLNLTGPGHRLQAIPAQVIQEQADGPDFCYQLIFVLGDVPAAASRLAHTVLNALEQGQRHRPA